jgi:hypothetical protein
VIHVPWLTYTLHILFEQSSSERENMNKGVSGKKYGLGWGQNFDPINAVKRNR